MTAKVRNPRKSRNPDLIRGVGKYSRSKMYHKRGLWAIKAKNNGVFPRHDPKPAAENLSQKPPKFYPADDVKKPLLNKRKHKPTNLRFSFPKSPFFFFGFFFHVFNLLIVIGFHSFCLLGLWIFRTSITPGTVLILLAGRFKGKRVVFLKQLSSGLLLVTGQSIFCRVLAFNKFSIVLGYVLALFLFFLFSPIGNDYSVAYFVRMNRLKRINGI